MLSRETTGVAQHSAAWRGVAWRNMAWPATNKHSHILIVFAALGSAEERENAKEHTDSPGILDKQRRAV